MFNKIRYIVNFYGFKSTLSSLLLLIRQNFNKQMFFMLFISTFFLNLMCLAKPINNEDALLRICYDKKQIFPREDSVGVIINDKISYGDKLVEDLCSNLQNYTYYYDSSFFNNDLADINPNKKISDKQLDLDKNNKIRYFLEYKKFKKNETQKNDLIGYKIIKNTGNRSKFFNDVVESGESNSEESLYLYDNKLALNKEDFDNLFGALVFNVSHPILISSIYGEILTELYEEATVSMFYFAHLNKCINERFNIDTRSKFTTPKEAVDIEFLDTFTNNIYYSKYSELNEDIRDDIILWASFIKSAIQFSLKSNIINKDVADSIVRDLYFNDPVLFVKKESDDYFILNNYINTDESYLVLNNFDLAYNSVYSSIIIDNYSHLDNYFASSDLSKDTSSYKDFINKNWPCLNSEAKRGYCGNIVPSNILNAISLSIDFYSILYLKYIKKDAFKSGWKKDKYIYGAPFTCDYKDKSNYSSFLGNTIHLRKSLYENILKKFTKADKYLRNSLMTQYNLKIEDNSSTQKYALKVIEINKQLDAIRIIDSRVKNEKN